MTNKHGQSVIAIDGTSASGKSTLSEELARAYGARRLEYSLFFRMIALHMLEQGFNPDAGLAPTAAQIGEASHYAASLNWDRVLALKDDDRLRTIEVSRTAPYFSGIESVCVSTDALICALIETSTDKPVIVEGRTIGKYVYPQADLKLFVDADLPVRAARRGAVLRSKGRTITDEEVMHDLAKRDAQDMSRTYQPTGFDPSIHIKIDTTHQAIEETLANSMALLTARLPGLAAGRDEKTPPSH